VWALWLTPFRMCIHMCNTWLIYVWALWLTPFRYQPPKQICTHLYSPVRMCIHLCNIWLIYMCNTWLIYVCVHLNSYPRWLRRRCDSDLFICVTWLIHMCNTRLIHMCVYIWINPDDCSAAIGAAAIVRCQWRHTYTHTQTHTYLRATTDSFMCVHK